MDCLNRWGRAAAIAVLGVAMSARPALAADVRTDPADDAEGDGPEITEISVERTGDELVVAVTFASAPPLTASGAYTDALMVFAAFDAVAPDEAMTGDGFAMGVHAATMDSGAMFVRIQNGQSGPAEPGVATAEIEGSVVTLRAPDDVLTESNTDSLHLLVSAVREGAGVASGDSYPSDGGWASYSVSELGGGIAMSDLVVGSIVGVGLVLAALIGFVAYHRPRPGTPLSTRPSSP